MLCYMDKFMLLFNDKNKISQRVVNICNSQRQHPSLPITFAIKIDNQKGCL